jgi:hypothetical protein
MNLIYFFTKKLPKISPIHFPRKIPIYFPAAEEIAEEYR